MNYKLKNMITQLYELSDKLDEGPFGVAQTSNTTLKNCIEVELLSYLMYLSAADGKIASEESAFFRDYFEYDFTTDDIHQLIVENHIYSTEFEQTVPLSMKVFVRADNTIYDEEGHNDFLASELLFDIFEYLGKEFLACDNDVSDDEIRDLTIYLHMLENYINNEVKSKKEKIFDIEEKNFKNNEKVENKESF